LALENSILESGRLSPTIPQSPTVSGGLDTKPQQNLQSSGGIQSSRSHIAGFDETQKNHPEIISYIDAAATEYGVDPFTVTQFAAFESGFNPNAVSSTGCTGLGQFSKGTWKQFGYGPISNRSDANLNARATANLLAYNQKHLNTFLGRPPNTTELYMAHQQGLGGAKKVLGKIKSGNGASHSGLSAKSLADNRITDTSANGVYNTMQHQMGRVLKDGLTQKDVDSGKNGITSSIMDSVKKPVFGGLVAPAPKSEVNDNASIPSKTNRESVAASKDCIDAAKAAEASKTDGCSPEKPSEVGVNKETPTSPAQKTGQGNTPNPNIIAAPISGQSQVKLAYPGEDLPTIVPDKPKPTTRKRFM
jgi:hypothetical protein